MEATYKQHQGRKKFRSILNNKLPNMIPHMTYVFDLVNLPPIRLLKPKWRLMEAKKGLLKILYIISQVYISPQNMPLVSSELMKTLAVKNMKLEAVGGH